MVDLIETRFDVTFQHPRIVGTGQVTDLSDRVLGSASGTEPVRTQAEIRPAVTASTPVPEGASADLFAQIAYRVALAEPSLAALGFPDSEYATAADGVTTISASDPARVSGTSRSR